MNLKKGTPACGLILGTILVVLGALVMWIGFWKTLLLALLFALGYFLGAIDKKKEFLKNTANRLIPEKEIKEIKVIDLKSELKREQELSQQAADDAAGHTAAKTKE